MADTVERQRIPEVWQFQRTVTETARPLAGNHLALSRFYAEKEIEARIFMTRTLNVQQRYGFRHAAEEMRRLAVQHSLEGVREAMRRPPEKYGSRPAARRV